MSMTPKQRILATLRGEAVDMLPFIPRLDIWYNANAEAGTLPYPYQKASLREIADDLDLGYHCVIPNFRDFREEGGDLDVGIGIYNLSLTPYTVKLHNIRRTHERLCGGRLRVKYETPKGELTTMSVFSEDMRKSGLTLYAVTEHAVKDTTDLDAMAYILSHAEVIPNYEKFRAHQEEFIGERGVSVALGTMYASPMHYLIKELMSVQDFYYAMADDSEKMQAFCEQIAPYFDSIMKTVAHSSAEVILSGANYDVALTPPPIFAEHITPQLRRTADILHANGKFLATHPDGENRGLLREYVNARIDIADSICPEPMTCIPLHEIRKEFDGSGITIWGAIPSVSVLESSMSDRDFEALVDYTLGAIGKGDHMILAIADTTPPNAKFERILYIQKKAREFGAIKASGG